MSDEPPFVSVVVPTRNRHTALARCLVSLANQEYLATRLEIIVANDGGLPIPQALTEPLRDRVALSVIPVPYGGPAAARNAGVAQSHGDVLAFIDDDCIAHPGWVRALVARLALHAEAAVGGQVINALIDNRYARASHHLIAFLYRYYHEQGRGTLPFFTTNNLGVSRNTFSRVGGFDPTYPFASEDRDWSDRLRYMGGALIYAPDAVVEHAHHLDLGSFLRQHFRYGEGARRFHQSRAKRRGTGVRLEQGGFYSGMLRAPFEAPDPESLRVAALLVASQVAGALGWAVAVVKDALSRCTALREP